MADSISSMPKEISEWLSEQTEIFGDIKFLTEFPPQPKATPLRQTIVSVGLESVKITDFFTENNEGELVPEEYCRLAEIKVRFSVYVPYSAGGTACHEAFTKIVDCLNFKSDLNLKESGCDAIEADRDAEAFVMKSWVIVEAKFCPESSSAVQYEAFMPKTFFCGSHINDSSKHVTAEEKESWGLKPEIGAYFGTGEYEQSIRVGFKPSLVIICRATGPVMGTDGNGTLNSYIGMANNTFASTGLKVTSTGFKVFHSSSLDSENTSTQLNAFGEDYVYIVFR